MLTLKLALRNLLRQKRRSLFTGLSMLVGFVLASFFIGWADGTYNHIIDQFTRNRLGHIQIHREGYTDKPSLYKTVGSPMEIGTRIAEERRIDSWTPRIFSAGLVSVEEKSAGARIIGIHPGKEAATTSFPDKITAGRYFTKASGEVIIGTELAKILEAEVGDEVAVFTQAADGSIAEDAFRIVGLVDTGSPQLNRSAFYMPFAAAQEFLVLWNQAHEIAITLEELRAVPQVTAALQEQLAEKEFEVAPWQEFASDFYRAMQADKNGMYISLLVVIIVVAITILNTILMAVLERRKEYGLMKAVGTRPGQIVKMVVAETLLLALACILLGSLIGWGLNSYFGEFGMRLSSPIEWGGVQLEYMKGEVNARSFYLPALTVLLTSLLVCLPPALRAARTEPARTMREF
jgi:ABC-type lipoprotein release transport system permease subunit